MSLGEYTAEQVANDITSMRNAVRNLEQRGVLQTNPQAMASGVNKINQAEALFSRALGLAPAAAAQVFENVESLLRSASTDILAARESVASTWGGASTVGSAVGRTEGSLASWFSGSTWGVPNTLIVGFGGILAVLLLMKKKGRR